MNHNLYKNYFKHFFDFMFSIVLLIILTPFYLTIILLLLIESRNSPFFIQERVGKNGMIFNLVKFRTMRDIKDSRGLLLPDGVRITKIGKLLRLLSLDELPQLINVIKGDMSIVGPRPLLVRYLPLYNKDQARRHEIKPGLTGWAQVNGRNGISWKEKFELDVWYVDHLSFRLDMKIVLVTLIKIFKREGIYTPDNTTMMPFNGNN